MRSMRCSAAFAAPAALLALALPAGAVKLRVRGAAALEARAVPAGGNVEVRGLLRDDAGYAIAAAHVRLSIRDRRGTAEVAASLPAAQACGTTQKAMLHEAPDELVIDTDAAGAFCVRLATPAIAGRVALRYPGTEGYLAASVELAVDTTRRSLALRFDPEPSLIPLDRPTHVLWVETGLEPEGAEDAGARDVLQLTLSDERGSELSRVAVRAGDRAQLQLASRDLAPPGPGKLVVRFAGSDTIAPAAKSASVQRTTRVGLRLAAPVARADPEQGAEIAVAVASAFGAVPGGTLEALLDGESVGTARVALGAARLVATFEPRRRDTERLVVRYLPDAPWWIAGSPLQVELPVAGPSGWRRLPWALGAAAILGWLARGWRRPARSRAAREDEPAPPPSGRASVELIEAGPPRSGWRGRVLDAHDGSPVPGARVAILVPAFAGEGLAGSAHAADDGSFRLEHAEGLPREGVRLEVSARWHATLERPLPPPGHVAIAVVTRRRALLERLVRWAARRGRPWMERGEPTPGALARIARRQGKPEVERWARHVESAAYGPDPVDEAAEARSREHEPRR
jgi:hypothetical protein